MDGDNTKGASGQLNADADVKPGIRENLSYGLGCGGIIFIFHINMSFMNMFWTDVLKIDLVVIGGFMLFNKFWDAVNDPIIGFIIDRTNSKMGRYRAWLFSFIPMIILGLLLYVKLPGGGTTQTVFTCVIYFLFVIAYTSMEVPHVSLMSTITTNYGARGVLASYRQGISAIVMIILSAIFMPIVMTIGKGDMAAGFTPTVAIMMVCSIPFFLLCIFGVKERVRQDPNAKTEKVSLVQSVKCLAGNTPAIMLCLVYLAWGVAIGMASGTRMYFFTYVAQDPSMGAFTANLTAMTIGYAAAGVIMAIIIKRFKNKRTIGMVMWAISAIFFIAMYLTPVVPGGDYMLYHALTFLSSIFGQMGLICVFALVPDVTEYTQLKRGLRASGFIFSIVNFSNQLGTTVVVSIFNWKLAGMGYIPGAEQPENIQAFFTAAVSLIPAIATVAGIVFFYFYKLNRETHIETLKKLEGIE